jgi:hypothetical protein
MVDARLFLLNTAVPDSLTGGGTVVHMHHRFIAILAIVCFAFGGAGCESLYQASLPKPKPPKKKKVQRERKERERKQYETVVMPLQTGSTLQRRMFVERKPDDDEPKKPSKKKDSPIPTPTPKPAAEATATPTPTEEATPEPTPERFR